MTITPTADDRDRNPCTRDVATSPTKPKRDERAQASDGSAAPVSAPDWPADARAQQQLLMTGDQAVAGWRGLEADQRWTWFDALYQQAAHLDRRYRLALRSGWWTDELQIELLAALGAWVGMFDHANWIDPEAKARLIFQLPAIRELLRGGAQQFDPEQDRHAFEHHLREHHGCKNPGDAP